MSTPPSFELIWIGSWSRPAAWRIYVLLLHTHHKAKHISLINFHNLAFDYFKTLLLCVAALFWYGLINHKFIQIFNLCHYSKTLFSNCLQFFNLPAVQSCGNRRQVQKLWCSHRLHPTLHTPMASIMPWIFVLRKNTDQRMCAVGGTYMYTVARSQCKAATMSITFYKMLAGPYVITVTVDSQNNNIISNMSYMLQCTSAVIKSTLP